MNRKEIVERLAKAKVVEKMCLNIAHASSLTPNLSDLSQIVYLVLLEYDEDKIVDMWESNALGFFIVRIITNQYCSNKSPFYYVYRRFSILHQPLTPTDYER